MPIAPLLLAALVAPGQLPAPAPAADPAVPAVAKGWYDRLSIRGYVHFRYQLPVFGDPAMQMDLDRGIGPAVTFSLRRARFALAGDVTDRVYCYFQPDFAAVPADGSVNFLQVRDLYADLALDEAKTSRVRVGQSKVPFGFEIPQSSQNRLALERTDAIASATKDDRDVGAFYYWAPAEIRQRFKHLVDSGLKGSGDYGVLGLGAYAGQGANRAEGNNQVHVIARADYPFLLPNGQFVEVGTSGYTGRFVPRVSPADPAKGIPKLDVGDPAGLLDQRVAAHFVVYPQPFGFQAEYNVGQGPRLDDARTSVVSGALQGGYAQAMYRWPSPWGFVTPFVRWSRYDGGKKVERDAPYMQVDDLEGGVEWQIDKALELTALVGRHDRTNPLVWPYVRQQATLLRMQVQWNF